MLDSLRYAIRNLWKQRAFSVVVILTLGLAIGATTSVYSVVHAVLIRPLPYRHAEQLVMIWNRYGKMKSTRAHNSPPDFFDRKRESRTLQNMSAIEDSSVNLIGRGEPQRLRAARVSASLFPTLGVQPFLGRNFQEAEDQPGKNSVVIISHALWKTQFGSDRRLLGQTLNLSGTQHVVIGVMPESFWFPAPETDVWTPIAFTAEQKADTFRGNEYLAMIARIKPGILLSQARAEMNSIAAGVLVRAPDRREFLSNAGWGAIVTPLRESLIGEIKPALVMFMAAVSLLLFIGCVNVINIFLARTGSREKEIAIRAALGAGRKHLIQMLLIESLLLSLLGGTIGILLAYGNAILLPSIAPKNLPRLSEIEINRTVLGFSMLVSFCAGLFTGIVPALRVSMFSPSESLKLEGTSTPARSIHRFRNGLVIAEIALALVLATTAALLAKSFGKLISVDPGFRTENRLAFTLSLPTSQYMEDTRVVQFYQTLMQQIEATPGVQSAGANASLPIAGENWTATFQVEGKPLRPGEPQPGFEYRMVTPHYFRAMGIPTVSGRDFNNRDTQDSPRVVVIDQNLANRFWPDENPIGKRLGFSNDSVRWREVVGVVGHVKNAGLKEEGGEQVYLPHAQLPDRVMSVVVHTTTDPRLLVPSIRSRVKSIDPNLPIYQIAPIGQIVTGSIAQPRFNMLILSVFASTALLLAAIGIYGLFTYSVTQRKKEIGIRMAVGARPENVLMMIIRQSMVIAGAGMIAGVTASLILSRFIESLLFRTQPVDPEIYAVTASVTILTALLASSIPAKRAAMLDPLRVLREE